MPKKIRELKAMLRKAGFTIRSRKGSHITWEHPKLPTAFTISGNDGNDAKPYQEHDVREVLKKLRKVQE